MAASARRPLHGASGAALLRRRAPRARARAAALGRRAVGGRARRPRRLPRLGAAARRRRLAALLRAGGFRRCAGPPRFARAGAAARDARLPFAAGRFRLCDARPGQRRDHAGRYAPRSMRDYLGAGGARRQDRGLRAQRTRGGLGRRRDGDARRRHCRTAGGSTARRPGSATAASPTSTACSRRPIRRPARAASPPSSSTRTTPGLDTSAHIEVMAPHPLATLRFDGCTRAARARSSASCTAASSSRCARSISFAPRSPAPRSAWPGARWPKRSSTRRSGAMFGQTLADFQLTQAKLGEMAALIDSAALLTYRAAWMRDDSERRGAAGRRRPHAPRRRWPRCAPPRTRAA